MPYLVPLEVAPNQTCDFAMDDCYYVLTIRALPGEIMVMDITRDGVPLVCSGRCLPDRPMITSRYLEGDGGNFMWETESGEYPYFTRFSGPDRLLYYTQEEVRELRS